MAITSVHPAPVQPALTTAVAPPSQPLWRFALIGLGPLTAMAIFALGVEVSHHLQ